jgi:hypothetical protein
MAVSTDPFIGKTWGSSRHSALIFMEYANHIRQEQGIDVYAMKGQTAANNSAIRRIIKQMRKDKTFADESILDDVEKELSRDEGTLSKEEQQAKDECNLAKARGIKQGSRAAVFLYQAEHCDHNVRCLFRHISPLRDGSDGK